MDILTEDGIEIYCLPDTAYCKISGENPESMIGCPLFAFDDYGNICKPNLCGEYTEN